MLNQRYGAIFSGLQNCYAVQHVKKGIGQGGNEDMKAVIFRTQGGMSDAMVMLM